MKTLIIALVALLGLLPLASHAQLGMPMDRPVITTDQPGFILVTTPNTGMETELNLTRVFSCRQYDEVRCVDYSDKTLAHTVIVRFASDFWMPGDMFRFHVEHDEKNGGFKIQFNDFPNADRIEVSRIDQEFVSILIISALP